MLVIRYKENVCYSVLTIMYLAGSVCLVTLRLHILIVYVHQVTIIIIIIWTNNKIGTKCIHVHVHTSIQLNTIHTVYNVHKNIGILAIWLNYIYCLEVSSCIVTHLLP